MGTKVGLRDTVENFKINVCDKLSNIEASKIEIDEILTDIHNKLASSSETLNSSWKDSNAVSTKNTILLLDNVALRLCQSVENDLGGVIETIIKINELIERINSNYQNMQNLNYGEYVSYVDTNGTTKTRYEANDQVQINEYNNENTTLNDEIEKIIKNLTNSVNSIDLKIEYDDNGIVTNVAEQYDSLDINQIIDNTIIQDSNDDGTIPESTNSIILCGKEFTYNLNDSDSVKQTLDDLEYAILAYDIEALKNGDKKGAAEFFQSESGKQMATDAINYYNFVNNAYLNGIITSEEREKYMRTLSNNDLNCLYSYFYYRLNGMHSSYEGDIAYAGDAIGAIDTQIFEKIDIITQSNGTACQDLLSSTITIDDAITIIDNPSVSTEDGYEYGITAMLKIRQGYLDGTYDYDQAMDYLNQLPFSNRYYSPDITFRNDMYEQLASMQGGIGYWLNEVEKYDKAAGELGLQTYFGSLAQTN